MCLRVRACVPNSEKRNNEWKLRKKWEFIQTNASKWIKNGLKMDQIQIHCNEQRQQQQMQSDQINSYNVKKSG